MYIHGCQRQSALWVAHRLDMVRDSNAFGRLVSTTAVDLSLDLLRINLRLYFNKLINGRGQVIYIGYIYKYSQPSVSP